MGGCWSKFIPFRGDVLSFPRVAAFGWLKRPLRMGTKIKGFLKGIKYISQIFVYKEHEMEIGYPTDVTHVVHVDLDDPSVTPPSWMKEFKTAPEFSSTSLANFGQRDMVSWASSDFQTPEELLQQGPDIPVGSPPRKTSRRKRSKDSSATRSSKPPKQKPSNADKQM
ncbi:CRIB domain-containing protein [Nymphaea thermarum]|nr:CRIB domain-containing protein [Nymphaea thermarum]